MLKETLDFLRVYKWYKNTLLFLPSLLILGLIPTLVNLNIWFTFIFFSLLSSGLYIFNDIMDIERDRLHPIKSKRLIASGQINKTEAGIISLFLIVLSLSFLQSLIAQLYFMIGVAYSLVLRNIPILDCLTISFNSILRLTLGYSVIMKPVNCCFVLFFFFVTVMTSLSKRAREQLITRGEVEYREFYRRITLKHIKVISVFNMILILGFLFSLVEYIGLLSSIFLGTVLIYLEYLLLTSPIKSGSFKTLIRNRVVRILLLCILASIILRLTV